MYKIFTCEQFKGFKNPWPAVRFCQMMEKYYMI